jgi:hypothetical protein
MSASYVPSVIPFIRRIYNTNQIDTLPTFNLIRTTLEEDRIRLVAPALPAWTIRGTANLLIR